jgi:hypothetical protein
MTYAELWAGVTARVQRGIFVSIKVETTKYLSAREAETLWEIYVGFDQPGIFSGSTAQAAFDAFAAATREPTPVGDPIQEASAAIGNAEI